MNNIRFNFCFSQIPSDFSMASQNLQSFEGIVDRYRGLTISSEGKNLNSEEFKTLLKGTLLLTI